MIAPAKQLFSLRQVSALVVVCTLFPTALAHAAIITRTASFSGPEQTANISILGYGTLSTNGSGQLGAQPLVVSPQGATLRFDPNPFTASTHPTSGPVQFSVDDQSGRVVGFSGLNLDLIDGVSQPIHFQPIGVNILLGGNPVTLPVTGEGRLNHVPFTQTEGAVISGSSFSVDGYSDLEFGGEITIAGIQVAQFSNLNLGAAFVAITGDITTTPLAGANSRDVVVSLDGSVSFVIWSSLYGPGSINFSTGPLTFSGYLAADLQRSYTVDFHLQTVLTDAIVPEPTSLVSLATGLFLIGGCMALRARQSAAV